jgi:hypothetical protein
MRKTAALLLVLLTLSSPALADGWWRHQRDRDRDWDRRDPPPKPTVAVPEIDPGAAVGGMTLLVLGTLMLTDRWFRKANLT